MKNEEIVNTLKSIIKDLIKEVLIESFGIKTVDREEENKGEKRNGVQHRGRVANPEHDRRLKSNRDSGGKAA